MKHIARIYIKKEYPNGHEYYISTFHTVLTDEVRAQLDKIVLELGEKYKTELDTDLDFWNNLIDKRTRLIEFYESLSEDQKRLLESEINFEYLPELLEENIKDMEDRKKGARFYWVIDEQIKLLEFDHEIQDKVNDDV